MGGARTWKSFDWDAMDRLHRKGLISDPVSKAKSVVFTDEGQDRTEAAYRRLFEAEDGAAGAADATDAAGPDVARR
ncbi:MAG: DUF6429 family protein [Rhodospirillales bacterium]|nr:DUF6429 family protein [Rhodospirillales bacterium]